MCATSIPRTAPSRGVLLFLMSAAFLSERFLASYGSLLNISWNPTDFNFTITLIRYISGSLMFILYIYGAAVVYEDPMARLMKLELQLQDCQVCRFYYFSPRLIGK